MAKKTAFFLKIILIAAVYFLTAKLGLNFNSVSHFAALVWFPTGISLACILLLGFNIWPAITIGAFLANFSSGAPLLVAIGIGIGNTLEALIGTYLLKKFIDIRTSLQGLKDVLGLIVLGAFISTLFSATIGVFCLYFGNLIPSVDFAKTWTTWWVGDVISDLVVAPLILVWLTRPYFLFNRSFKRILEIFGLIILLVIVMLVIYQDFFEIGVDVVPRAYLIFPALIWSAIRFGSRGAATTTFVVSFFALFFTSLGYGPFRSEVLSEGLLSAETYLIVVSISGLLLSAVANERHELEERKDEFISIASHELKTPITTIKGYTQILGQILKRDKSKKNLFYVSRMEEQLDRLTKLVNDLLDVSKMQSNKIQLHKEKVDIKELVYNIIADNKLLNNHKLIFETKEKDLNIWADKYYINMVLMNLVSNAIKYSPRSDEVVIYADREKDNLIVSVEDFGIGISKRDQKNVFDKFFRADNRIRQSFSGLGLGLYIASEIIKQHQGSIWLKSIKGKGTIFSFKLPIRGGKKDE